MDVVAKPGYVRRRHYRRVNNPKAAQPLQNPKPVDCVASTSDSIPENKDDFEKFPRHVVRKGGVIQKWMHKLYQKKNVVEEIVQTQNLFASLSMDHVVEVQPELNAGASLDVGESGDPFPSSGLAEVVFGTASTGDPSTSVLHLVGGDNLNNNDGVHGSEDDQCVEVVRQTSDTKVEVPATDFTDINVAFHADSALFPKSSGKFGYYLPRKCCSGRESGS
ncbi:hypothetical protein LIER_37661 [Lithospermum erythrorhizon]|uniref:Uncharacterized protein n=1 Tax=Lithospermum erythrorhizon TaxID=34254 RepID=A0AAV3PSQ0_LITER